MTTRKCKNCSGDFIPSHGSQKYCKEDCRLRANVISKRESRRSKKTVNSGVCQNCAERFVVNHGRMKYCSDKCRQAACYKRNHLSASMKAMNKQCKLCGNLFETVINEKIYCTRDCAKRAKGTREVERKRKERLEYWKSNPLSCLRCGEEFVREDAKQKFCTKECRIKWNREKKSSKYNSKKELKRYHSMMDNGNYDRSISVKALIDRVGIKCSICGKDTILSDHYFKNGTFVAGEEYPSVDHIMPISKGGTHSWDNVQLAHRRCNTKKKAELAYETKSGQYRLSV